MVSNYRKNNLLMFRSGILLIKAVGGESTLSQIIKLVEDAQTQKPKIQAIADKVSGFFVPVVLGLASVTFIVWFILGIFDIYPGQWKHIMGAGSFTFAMLFGISVVVVRLFLVLIDF